MDIWVCKYFKVLPTDERFKALTENQKILLYKGFVQLPTDEMIWVSENEENNSLINSLEEANLDGLGYTKNQLEKIKEQLLKAGLK